MPPMKITTPVDEATIRSLQVGGSVSINGHRRRGVNLDLAENAKDWLN